MDYNKAALELHSKFPGKIAVQSLCECKDRDALSTAYTPGVAEPCRKIKANPDDVYTYTMKGRTVAVVTNGTAVLGLGNIGPEAGLPVMEGKCVLFKEFGGVDAFPICLNAKTKEEVIAAVKAIAPTFGGINLEDIRSPECFEIEAELERDLDIPVFHDDQHGTAIIVLAGVLNALKVVGKRIEDVKIVQNGPGAAGTAIIHMLQVAGARNIIAVDEHGILLPGRPAGLEGHKGKLAEETNPEKLSGGLAEAIRDADIFIGTSIAGALTPELAATMAKDAIVFAMANPTPEIMPDLAKQAGVRADHGVGILFAAHTGPPALQVMRQSAAADLAQFVLLFQARYLNDGYALVLCMCLVFHLRPSLHGIHKGFFNAAEQHHAQHKGGCGNNQAVDQAAAALVLTGGNGLLGQAAFFGCKGDQLLVVQGDTQLVGNGLCNLTAAGCVLTRHSNDHRFLHTDTPR